MAITAATSGESVSYVNSINSGITEPSTTIAFASATTMNHGSGSTTTTIILIESPNYGWVPQSFYINKYGLKGSKKYLFANENELTAL